MPHDQMLWQLLANPGFDGIEPNCHALCSLCSLCSGPGGFPEIVMRFHALVPFQLTIFIEYIQCLFEIINLLPIICLRGLTRRRRQSQGGRGFNMFQPFEGSQSIFGVSLKFSFSYASKGMVCSNFVHKGCVSTSKGDVFTLKLGSLIWSCIFQVAEC